MKLINEDMKGQKFNIDGKDILVDEKGILELDNKEAAKSLCQHAGFKLIRSAKQGDVEPPKTAPIASVAPVIESIQGMDDLDEAAADLEAEAALNAELDGDEDEAELPESEKTEEEIAKEPVKEAPKAPEAPKKEPQGKWLPGKNNKQSNK